MDASPRNIVCAALGTPLDHLAFGELTLGAAPNLARYFVLSTVGFMAAGCLVILIVKLADRRPKPMGSETYRPALWLAAVGVLAFLAGMGLAVLPQVGSEELVAGLIGGGFLVLVGSTLLDAKARKMKVGRAKQTAIPPKRP